MGWPIENSTAVEFALNTLAAESHKLVDKGDRIRDAKGNLNGNYTVLADSPNSAKLIFTAIKNKLGIGEVVTQNKNPDSAVGLYEINGSDARVTPFGTMLPVRGGSFVVIAHDRLSPKQIDDLNALAKNAPAELKTAAAAQTTVIAAAV